MDTASLLPERIDLSSKNDGDEAAASGVVEVPFNESRVEMLARHQREIKDLQNKDLALKIAAAKGSKAEQKAKKKQVQEEMTKLEMKLHAKHAKELASFCPLPEDNRESLLDGLVKSFAAISTPRGTLAARSSKSQKRRDKRAQQEAEREQKIQEEQNSTVSDRTIEDQRLEQKLRPLGLTLKEIMPDGHCLYRAVEDQLSLYPTLCPQPSYQQLREMAAAYMRSHAQDFVPFIGAESDDDLESRESLEEKFEKYCQDVESTVAWGGQLELGALTHRLRKHIIVYSGDLPDVEMGKEYESITSEDSLSVNPSLRLSYHRHAFGLGEHYNSVVPLQDYSLQVP